MAQHTMLTNERGAVLITGLLILIILSVLGLTTMQSTLLQEKWLAIWSSRTLLFRQRSLV